MSETTLTPGNEAFASHVFNALDVPPRMLPKDIGGGAVHVFEKSPPNGPVTLFTLGASRIPTEDDPPVEFAIETVEDQPGPGFVGLEILCDAMASRGMTPPLGKPIRLAEPMERTQIEAIVVTPSRWGDDFDQVRTPDGELVGHLWTIRLLTSAEALFVEVHGWDALVEKAGSIDALLDVLRDSVVPESEVEELEALKFLRAPVYFTKLHDEYPPRWVTYLGSYWESFTGVETDEYMEDESNHEMLSLESFLTRFPFVANFVRQVERGQSARFEDQSGAFILEDG